MNIRQLSLNSYQLTEVFESDKFAQLKNLLETFTPDYVQSNSAGRREKLAAFNVISKDTFDYLVNIIKQLTPNFDVVTAIELWRDFPGYTNFDHVDDPTVENIMIVYFGSGPGELGTRCYDPEEIRAPYESNTGFVLLNSNKITHGLVGQVHGVDCRQTIYINWKTK